MLAWLLPQFAVIACCALSWPAMPGLPRDYTRATLDAVLVTQVTLASLLCPLVAPDMPTALCCALTAVVAAALGAALARIGWMHATYGWLYLALWMSTLSIWNAMLSPRNRWFVCLVATLLVAVSPLLLYLQDEFGAEWGKVGIAGPAIGAVKAAAGGLSSPYWLYPLIGLISGATILLAFRRIAHFPHKNGA